MESLIRRLKFLGIFSIFYFTLFYFVVGWRTDHLMLYLVIAGLTLVHKYGFHAVLALTGIIGWTVLYDTMTFLPNYMVNDVHIKDLYDLELSMFGVIQDGQCISLCEWFQTRTSTFLSLFCGASYLLWIPAPMAFALYILWKDHTKVAAFAYGYLLTNIVGIIVYYLFPAAPPWYYFDHGNVFDNTVIGSEGLLAEFDSLVGAPIFNGIYTKGSNIFGAIPSLHAAYPLLCLFFAVKYNYKGFIVFFVIMSIGTWIGAVYSQHHYVIDVLLGILCAVASYLLMMQIMKTSAWQKLHQWYHAQFVH